MATIDRMRPRWIFSAALWSKDYCADVISTCEDIGFVQGSYADGTKRDNVQVRFLNRRDHGKLFETIDEDVTAFAEILGIDIYPDWLDEAQISKWSKGDHYGVHCDHDTTRSTHIHDRKVSFYVSLSDGGGLDLGLRMGELSNLRANTGDSIVMSSLLQHSRPNIDDDVTRYSLVAWIPGPRWR